MVIHDVIFTGAIVLLTVAVVLSIGRDFLRWLIRPPGMISDFRRGRAQWGDDA
jgi:hypothetical protein